MRSVLAYLNCISYEVALVVERNSPTTDEQFQTETARQRLKVLEQSQDGFSLRRWMRFRGPGEVLGTRQSGLPDFTLVSLVEDQEVLD